jgi:hypothetical protein
MATNRTRKRRGAKTQALIAEYLRSRGWPFAEDAGSGRPGADVLGVPGLAIEVKARRDLSLPKWLRQASTRNGLPIVVHRPDGFGPGSIDDWPATLRLTDLVWLLREAGFGNGPTAREVPAPPPLKDNRSLGEFFDG